MARVKPLTAPMVNSKSLKPGRHADGNGLYLLVKPDGRRSWVFIWTKAGRRREMGLGSVQEGVKLAEARERASAARRVVRDGGDPIAERRKSAVPTFKKGVSQYLSDRDKNKGFRTDKTRNAWYRYLETHAAPLNNILISDITTDDVYSTLNKIWSEKPVTANRTRGYIEHVLSYAKGRGWREGPNPAQWRGNLSSMLTPVGQVKPVKHHASMPWQELPAFMRELRAREAIAARLLEFVILTACRTGEARFAVWDEFDLDGAFWRIPAERMKMKRDHAVPLSEPALKIVRQLAMRKLSDYVFTNPRNLRPFSINSPRALLKRMGHGDVTAHGYRASFKTFSTEVTSHSRTTIEISLAHKVGNSLDEAYMLGELLEKRRALMNQWARHCGNTEHGAVVQFSSKAN